MSDSLIPNGSDGDGSDDGDLRVDRADRDPGGDGALLPRLRHVGHHRSGAARRPRRPQAGAPAHPLGDARRRGPPRSVVHEVRPGRGRGHGQVPPPRQSGHLRRPGPHGPGLLAPSPARRRARQLRLARLLARRRALHRVPAGHSGHAPARRHRRGHRRLRPQLLGRVPAARGAPGPVPEPARQRQPGHRGRHGHQHPAPQPGRGGRRHAAPDRPSRRHPRRPDAVRQGPRLPDRRHRSWAGQGSSTPTEPVEGRSSSGPGPRSKRAGPTTASSSRRCRTRPRSWRPRRASRISSTGARSRASPTSTTSRPGAQPGW